MYEQANWLGQRAAWNYGERRCIEHALNALDNERGDQIGGSMRIYAQYPRGLFVCDARVCRPGNRRLAPIADAGDGQSRNQRPLLESRTIC